MEARSTGGKCTDVGVRLFDGTLFGIKGKLDGVVAIFPGVLTHTEADVPLLITLSLSKFPSCDPQKFPRFRRRAMLPHQPSGHAKNKMMNKPLVHEHRRPM